MDGGTLTILDVLDPTVATDLPDYAPASTAFITASNFTVGSTLEFQVLHVVDAGADGLYGTADDTPDDSLNASGSGHEAWYVTDGVRLLMAGLDGLEGTADDYWWGDLDGIANGTVVTSWYVNPDDCLGATFLLTAGGVDAGVDGVAGTADDVATGEAATSSFTDTGGSYSINFAAADPDMYIPPIPFPESVSPISGRGNGDLQIPSAWFESPVTNTDVRVESLAPEDMALHQIVPFEIKITVDGSVAPENGVITLRAGWNIDTTSNADFGYDESYGVYAAFVDTGDGAHFDPEGDATVQSFTWSVVGDEIQGTFIISGLDDGDVVVVEPWLVLEDFIPAGATGNVQSRLIDAQAGAPGFDANPNRPGIQTDVINTGNQTVPLLRVQEFFTADADLAVIKRDNQDGVMVITAGDDPVQSPLDYAVIPGETDYARAAKTPYEIACMTQATTAGVRAHRAAEAGFRAGASEYEIHLAYCRAAGAREEELPYNNIIAFDTHAAVLHYQVLDRQRPAGVRSFLIDAGAQHAGYACDITRTYAAAPGPFQDLITALDAAQRLFADRVRPGVDYREIHLEAHRAIAAILVSQGLVSGSAEAAFETFALAHRFSPLTPDEGEFQFRHFDEELVSRREDRCPGQENRVPGVIFPARDEPDRSSRQLVGGCCAGHHGDPHRRGNPRSR